MPGMEGCSVAVIGCGPAGVLCAAQFAKQGANVTVYERRTYAEQQDPGIGWSIAIGGVAVQSIEAAGLSADLGPLKKCVSPPA
jgi:2-polyprenyl-6-methoxyphenol hydroxylase-like FAD-dependent oxidoreductase